MLRFALSFASGSVVRLKSSDIYKKQLAKDETEKQPWLITYCLTNQETGGEDEGELNYELNCLDEVIQNKLAIMLHGLVKVASVNCVKEDAKELCGLLKPQRTSPIVYYSCLPNVFVNTNKSVYQEHLMTTDYKKMVELILSYLPKVKQLSLEEFKSVLAGLREENNAKPSVRPHLIQFLGESAQPNSFTTNLNEYKRLPSLLGSGFTFAQFDCALVANTEDDCRIKFKIFNYPTFVLFKSIKLIGNGLLKPFREEDEETNQDWYEIYYSSRQSPQDLSQFVKDNAYTPVRTLKDFDLETAAIELVTNNKQAFFVDFFAP